MESTFPPARPRSRRGAIAASLAILLAVAATALRSEPTATTDPDAGSTRATAMTNAKNDFVLQAAIYIRADYGAVWDSFTKPDSYAAWSSAPGAVFGSKVGDPVAWGFPGRTVYEGTIQRIEKGKGLAHTFSFVGFGFEEPPTRVEIDIAPQGPVVLVRLRHECLNAPQTAEMIGELGWAKSLSRLKTLLETGEAMPWPEEGEAAG